MYAHHLYIYSAYVHTHTYKICLINLLLELGKNISPGLIQWYHIAMYGKDFEGEED